MGKKQKKEGGFWQDFKKFIAKGNIIDLAVAVVIGAAFTAITNSLVKDIVMPLLGWIIGDVDMSELKIILKPAVLAIDGVTVEAAEVAIRYGVLINSIINFLLIALVIFAIIRFIRKTQERAQATVGKLKRSKMTAEELAAEAEELRLAEEKKRAEEEAAKQPAPEIVLLTEIRDSLKELNAKGE